MILTNYLKFYLQRCYTILSKYINDIFIHLTKMFVMSIFVVQILLRIKNFMRKLKHLEKWRRLVQTMCGYLYLPSILRFLWRKASLQSLNINIILKLELFFQNCYSNLDLTSSSITDVKGRHSSFYRLQYLII